MAGFSDDLDFNPFYRALQTNFGRLFEEAQNNCWLICVPQSNALKELKFSTNFVESHILKPSPFFTGQFTSTDKGETKTVELEGRVFRTVKGFSKEETVKILYEEIGYNQLLKPFKILIIERPLDPVFHVHKDDKQGAKKLMNSTNGERTSFSECQVFLENYPCRGKALKMLKKKLYQFTNNYMLLPQYLHDAADRLQDIISVGVTEILHSHSPQLLPHDTREISAIVENYVMGYVHQKLFSIVQRKFAADDKYLSEKLTELYKMELTADQLGVKERFCCQLPRAKVELASLDGKTTPAEKLHCLKTTLELISEEVKQLVQENPPLCPFSQLQETSVLTSDDLIPLLVTLLVQVRPRMLESNLYYIQNFHWHLSPKDKLSYSLVTFQAAKEYVKSTDFTFLQPSRHKMKKEMSLEELMEVTVELQKNSSKKEVQNDGTVRVPKPFDRQLEKITKMIEASTQEHRDRENQVVPEQHNNSERHKRQASKDGLGEFLTNLQHSSLGVSFGKQN
ncbi:ankyrin repeat domain-containing protein 27-like [Tachypleus tridentatus]|uniref:ankyrin repeat domain-containing protein 27-like n=1 Tax=Tachypleus tridentatus TaxID=6853 RepID=UPI003FD231F5